MKRSVGLTLVGVLVILLSALLLVFGCFVIFAMLTLPASAFAAQPTAPQLNMKLFATIGAGIIFLFAAFGLVNGIGLIRRWSWCRYVTIVFGFLASGFSLVALLFTLLIPFPATPGLPPDTASGFKAGISLFYGFWIVVFLGISLFLIQKKTAEEFMSPQSGPSEPRPLAVWAVAGLLMAGVLALPMMFAMQTPMFFLGITLSPVPGKVLIVLWILISIAIGLSLFRRVRAAFWYAVAFYVIGLINGVILLFPGPSERFYQLILQSQYAGNYPGNLLRLSMYMTIVAAGIPLFLLLIGYRRFVEWCEHKAIQNGSITQA